MRPRDVAVRRAAERRGDRRAFGDDRAPARIRTSDDPAAGSAGNRRGLTLPGFAPMDARDAPG